MKIVETSIKDLNSVLELVENVSQLDILPHFSKKGQVYFSSKVLPDIETAFDKVSFQSLKLIENGTLIGFGAIRDGEYITHLFIAKTCQGLGLGKLLLERLVDLSTSNKVSLRASINSVSFYEHQGFKATDKESEVNGIRFVPMSKTIT